jgi:hypothetical protein
LAGRKVSGFEVGLSLVYAFGSLLEEEDEERRRRGTILSFGVLSGRHWWSLWRFFGGLREGR